jgi:hypothetical protein
MNKEDFTGLPLRTALGVLYDVFAQPLERVAKPDVPRPPKYDDRFPKKKGLYVWVSEMTLSDLTWWRGKKAESAASGGQWAEKDSKWVGKLDKWIAWRELFPAEVWSGTRGDDRATAAPPSREPALHAWDNAGSRGSAGARQSSSDTTGGGFSDADYGNKTDEDDIIPF